MKKAEKKVEGHAGKRESPSTQHEKIVAKPRLPHERDESRDSQAGPQHDVIKQAHDDIVSGQQDTDLRNPRGLDKPTR
jgi:hypothetical protein